MAFTPALSDSTEFVARRTRLEGVRELRFWSRAGAGVADFAVHMVPPYYGSCCAVDARRAQQKMGAAVFPERFCEDFFGLS